MNGLLCGEECMKICLAVLIQYQRVTDGQTDESGTNRPIAQAQSSPLDTIVLDFGLTFAFWNDGAYCEGTVSKKWCKFDVLDSLVFIHFWGTYEYGFPLET